MLADLLRVPQVHTLTIPLVVLNLAASLHSWPHLVHLSIDVYETRMFPPRPFIIHEGPPIFDWAALECLRALPRALDSLQLHVRVSSDVDEPTLEDARALKARLSSLRDHIPCDEKTIDLGMRVRVQVEVFYVIVSSPKWNTFPPSKSR